MAEKTRLRNSGEPKQGHLSRPLTAALYSSRDKLKARLLLITVNQLLHVQVKLLCVSDFIFP